MQKSWIWTWSIAIWSPDMEIRCMDKDIGAAEHGVWPRIWSTRTWIQEFSIIADLDMDGAGIKL